MTADDLPKRTPGKALEEGTPKEIEPSPVSLFNVNAGDLVVTSFEVARLRRARRGQSAPESAG